MVAAEHWRQAWRAWLGKRESGAPDSTKEEQRMPAVFNLHDGVPRKAEAEIFTALLERPGIRIERIVSTGQATPADAPFRQDHEEWVLLLSGAAGLWIEGEGEVRLLPGDCVTIAAGAAHRVTWTDADAPTVWLAVHLG
jgi:cupin 2 domain-containing protein